jgi:uncharacterized damage-inducible protein DinB
MKTENVENLRFQIAEMDEKLPRLTDGEMQKELGTGLWSGKEILGHLSDSAALNRQRIVRSQYEEPYEFPFYDQAQWVEIQAYAHYDWEKLVAQCIREYRHLLHVLDNLPDTAAADPCPITFSSSEFVTLDWLVGHIYRHNDHHLRQIFWLVGESNLPDDRDLYLPIEELP